jgi:hypothetical protein
MIFNAHANVQQETIDAGRYERTVSDITIEEGSVTFLRTSERCVSS